MIQFLDGRPGGYKSYTAVSWACRYLSQGGTVASSIQLNVPEIIKYVRRRYDYEVNPAQIILLKTQQEILSFYKFTPAGTIESPTLVIIDEAGRYWNARDWGQTQRELLDFLALSRHEHTDIILIDQHFENVDKQFRRLVEHFWRVRDFQKIIGLPVIMRIRNAYDGKTKTGGPFFEVKNPAIYKLYNSHQVVVKFDRLVRPDIPKGRKLKKRRMFKVLIIAILLCVVPAGLKLWGKFRARPVQLVASTFPGSAAAASKPDSGPTGPSIVFAHFYCTVSRPGGLVARTVYGDFARGAWTPYGLVVGVVDGTVYCRTDAGADVLIVHRQGEGLPSPDNEKQ